MTQVLTRPTNHDEDWRYAAPAYLADADLTALAQWEELAVAAGEKLQVYRVVDNGQSEVVRLRVHVAAGGTLELAVVNTGSPYARFEAEVTLAKGAHFEFGGVTLGGGEAVQEFVTRVIHAEPEATSNQVVRAVQWGRSTGNFLGRIEVVRDAQKTDAGQNFRAILLGKGATANAKPELEIYADDVKCAHGAAIGALDQQAGFYMASRGIPPEAARKLLVRAFIADAFEGVSDEGEQTRLLDTALAALEEAAL